MKSLSKSWVLLFTLVTLLLTSACGSGVDNGPAKKVGQIIKIGNHGVFVRTWEGEIVRGGFSGGDGANGNITRFTVFDDATAHAMEKAMEDRSEVEITYNSRGLVGVFTAESDNFVTGFRVLSTPAHKDQ